MARERDGKTFLGVLPELMSLILYNADFKYIHIPCGVSYVLGLIEIPRHTAQISHEFCGVVEGLSWRPGSAGRVSCIKLRCDTVLLTRFLEIHRELGSEHRKTVCLAMLSSITYT